jgi:hypothetical protein
MRPQASLPFHSIVQILAGYYFPSYDLNLFTDSDIEETVMARVVLRKRTLERRGGVHTLEHGNQGGRDNYSITNNTSSYSQLGNIDEKMAEIKTIVSMTIFIFYHGP